MSVTQVEGLPTKGSARRPSRNEQQRQPIGFGAGEFGGAEDWAAMSLIGEHPERGRALLHVLVRHKVAHGTECTMRPSSITTTLSPSAEAA